MKFAVTIHASKETVWATLWQGASLRVWMDLVDPGTYMVGELAQGSTVQFNSGSGYGVTSLVAELTPNEYVLFKHQADTKEDGAKSRDDQWTGGTESYELTEANGITTLAMKFDVPVELEQIMSTNYSAALNKIKEMAESGKTS